MILVSEHIFQIIIRSILNSTSEALVLSPHASRTMDMPFILFFTLSSLVLLELVGGIS